MIKNQKGGFSAVYVVVILAAIFIAAGAYYINSMNSAEEKTTGGSNKSSQNPGWKTYAWADSFFPDVTFDYPSDWEIKNIKEPGWEGLRIQSRTSKSSEDSIVIAWPRFSNECLSGKCVLVGSNQLSTFSKNPETLKVFSLLAKSIEIEPNGIEIIYPIKGEVLEAGKTYTFKWGSKEPKVKKVSAEVFGEFTGNFNAVYKKDLPASGEIQISIPKGELPEGEEREYGPYVFVVHVPEGDNRPTYEGGNPYAGFSPLFFIKSSTGISNPKW